MRAIQSLCYGLGAILFLMGQTGIWTIPLPNTTIPYLLSSISLILMAIYLKDNK